MKFANLIENADLDSLTKLWRKLGKANIDLTPIMQSPAKFRNLQAFIEAGYPKIDLTQGVVVQSTFPDSEELTQLILDYDYLPAEKTAEVFGFNTPMINWNISLKLCDWLGNITIAQNIRMYVGSRSKWGH